MQLFLPCAAGVEPYLEAEARAVVPAATVEAMRGGVAVGADLAAAMALNLESRLAQRVLVEVARGPYAGEDDLYAMARGVDWSRWMTPRQTLAVATTAQRSPLRSLHFAGLRIKDAVCDALREATGLRPDVDTRQPDLPLVLHVGEREAWLYVDTSGEPLFKRGWRVDAGDAPLKETLAAAMLAAAGWRGTADSGGALHDPCCGSGTIAIEAAQIARGIAPGARRRFAFERQLPFGTPSLRAAWRSMLDAAAARVHASAVPIVASDVSFRMVDFARRNAERAGVADTIEFHGGDALERPPPALAEGVPGTLLVNPPYGARIEVAGKAGAAAAEGEAPRLRRVRQPSRDSVEDRDLPDDFFARLAAHWKRAYAPHPAGWTAWILSPDAKLPGAMRLAASRRVPMWNGPIECRLFRFDLVAGSARRLAPSP